MKLRSRTIALVFTLVVMVAVPLYAHMKIEKTEPAADSTLKAAPKQIQVWFNEAPDVKVTKMDLTGPSGAMKLAPPRVDGKSIAATVQGPLSDGAYTATWQSAGDDGHVQKGEIKFTLRTK